MPSPFVAAWFCHRDKLGGEKNLDRTPISKSRCPTKSNIFCSLRIPYSIKNPTDNLDQTSRGEERPV